MSSLFAKAKEVAAFPAKRMGILAPPPDALPLSSINSLHGDCVLLHTKFAHRHAEPAKAANETC